MTIVKPAVSGPLRIYCIEDNPLIVVHLEQLIEDAGHLFAGAVDSFWQLKAILVAAEVDGALVDIDLTDGRTGPAAAGWLKECGVPSLFVTGQVEIATEHAGVTLGVIAKPIAADDLAQKIELFRNAQ
jgi:DNA-binding LytR/AlgR family response regulator